MLATLGDQHAWAGPLQLQAADGSVRAVLATVTPLPHNAGDDDAQRYLAILAG
jgi:hypothetical protein